jgi:hypothetical protein
MKKTEIEHMWKVASNNPHHDTNWHDPAVVAFAQLVARKEREECAKLCETYNKRQCYNDEDMAVANECAAAIRARGQA